MDDDQEPEWIDAHGAIEMLLQMYGERQGLVAAKALCTRAYGGLVKTRAQLFKWETLGGGTYGNGNLTREAEWAKLPEQFWWAKGGAGLKQNWVSGDFSTWIDQRFHWEAFGVEFSLTDVDAMLKKRVKPSLNSVQGKLNETQFVRGVMPSNATLSDRKHEDAAHAAAQIVTGGKSLSVAAAIAQIRDMVPADNRAVDSIDRAIRQSYNRMYDRRGQPINN